MSKADGCGRNGKPPPIEHRWKKNQSGNPTGSNALTAFGGWQKLAKVGQMLTEWRVLPSNAKAVYSMFTGLKEKGEIVTHLHIIIARLITKAANGDTKAAALLFRIIYGDRPAQVEVDNKPAALNLEELLAIAEKPSKKMREDNG